MKEDSDDTRIKELFAVIKDADGRNAPLFGSMASGSFRQTYVFTPVFKIAAAATAVLSISAATMMLQMCGSPSAREADQITWTEMSGWQASTDNLLSMSDPHIDGSVSTGTDIWLDDQELNVKGNL